MSNYMNIAIYEQDNWHYNKFIKFKYQKSEYLRYSKIHKITINVCIF